MNLPANFDKTKFTHEELQIIKDCVRNGQIETIATLIGHNLSPLKESELEKLKNELVPLKVGYENKVRTVLHELSQISNQSFIQNPLQEAIIQKFLDKELGLIEQKNRLSAKINEMSAEIKEIADPKNEELENLKKELKVVEKTYKQEFDYKKLKENLISACNIILDVENEEDVKTEEGEEIKNEIIKDVVKESPKKRGRKPKIIE